MLSRFEGGHFWGSREEKAKRTRHDDSSGYGRRYRFTISYRARSVYGPLWGHSSSPIPARSNAHQNGSTWVNDSALKRINSDIITKTHGSSTSGTPRPILSAPTSCAANILLQAAECIAPTSTTEQRNYASTQGAFKHSTADEALNSWHTFKEQLSSINLNKIATYGPLPGAAEDDVRGPKAMRDLQKALTSFTAGSSEIVTSFRTSFQDGEANAFVKLQHVYDNYVKPELVEHQEAERRIKDFNFKAWSKMDATEFSRVI